MEHTRVVHVTPGQSIQATIENYPNVGMILIHPGSYGEEFFLPANKILKGNIITEAEQPSER